MSYIYGNQISKEETIEKLESYRNMVIEPIDYTIGDYVMVKPETKYLNRDFVPYHYIFDISNGIVTAGYMNKSELMITNITPCYYKKIDKSFVSMLLQNCIDDVCVAKDVVSGVLVRNRLHHSLKAYDSNSLNHHQFIQPVLVMNNNNGDITVAGIIENENRISEKTFKWYELASYY